MSSKKKSETKRPPDLPQKSRRRSLLVKSSSSPPNDMFADYISASSPTTNASSSSDSEGRLSVYSVSDYGDDSDFLHSPIDKTATSLGEDEDAAGAPELGHVDAKLVYRRINSSRRRSRQLALEALQTTLDIAF